MTITVENDPIKEAARAALTVCEEQRQEENDRHAVRLAEIESAEERLTEIVDSEIPQPSPPQVAAEPESKPAAKEPPTPPRSTPPPKPPARGGRRATVSPQEARERKEKIVAFVKANPGCSQDQIADHLGVRKEQIREPLQKLCRMGGKLEGRGKNVARRYYHRNAPLTPSTDPAVPPAEPERRPQPKDNRDWLEETLDDDPPAEPSPPAGAPAEGDHGGGDAEPTPAAQNGSGGDGYPYMVKTDLEREVYDLLGDGPRTGAWVGVKLKLTEKKLAPVLSALVVRGVLRRSMQSAGQPLFELVS